MRLLYSDFAYSTTMQLILAALTFTETFIAMYMISNMIMVVFKVKLEKWQKVLFTLINGPLLHTTFVYGVYIVGGMVSFSPLVFLLVVNVNPVAALVYYYSALKIFKLSKERSLKLMSYMLIIWAMKIALGRLLHAMFNLDQGAEYNYLMDAVQQTVTILLFVVINFAVLRVLKKTQVSMKFLDSMFFDKRKEMLLYFLESLFIFATSTIVPILVAEQIAANVIVTLILLLFTVVCICLDIYKYNAQVISNLDLHIHTLFQGMEELRGVKHDFNNILHTYSGYLELKEYQKLERYHASLVSVTSHAGNIADLALKVQENPPVISLLINKMHSAEQMGVKLLISLKCRLDELYIDNMDVTRILACLLDYAIETASQSEQRKTFLTIESKHARSKLIIVSNSAALPDVPEPDAMPTISDARQLKAKGILNKYGNCSYQIEYRGQGVSTYVELRSA